MTSEVNFLQTKDAEIPVVPMLPEDYGRNSELSAPLILSGEISVSEEDFVDPVFESLVFNGRCQGITSSTKDISSDLPCFLVGEEEEPNTDT